MFSSIHVCPRVQVSSKKERWQITYSCSQLSKSASTSDAATTIAPAATVQLMLASTMTIQPTSSSSSAVAATKPMASIPLRIAIVHSFSSSSKYPTEIPQVATSQETTSTTTTPKPTSMPAGAALVLQMPGIPVMAIMPGVSSMAISMGQKPMLQVTSGKPASVTGQMSISVSGAKVNEAASTSPKPDATIKTTTLKPGGPIMTLIGQIMPRPGSVASTFQSFDLPGGNPPNSTRSPMGKRAKRNTDWFDLLHQSNRCERAYKICVTRSKHYVISKLKRPRLDNDNGQSVDCSNNKNPVKIVNGNLCNYPSPATIPTTPGIPILPTPPRPVIHEPNTIVTNFSEALDAIIIQDSEASGESSDFYPQHGPYVVPIPPQRPARKNVTLGEIGQVESGCIRRVTDEQVRALALEIAGTNVSTTYVYCPKNPRASLGIYMPYLVMVIKGLKRYFTFEVTVLDDRNVHRRFRISNFQRSRRVDHFCTSMPLSMQPGWNEISFDLASFVRKAYKTNYVETTRIKINANCRIRVIYFCDK
ncbi:unnamed protein product [Trichogramma brassicae]|uniref:CFA20 domain-containing protein n=1 Tax=Trichogramma brassicae TaxID=86971 RepID=A0A6H5I2A1_9HYME|nr:unnamed protein product [Trichogramma brassicae]